MFVKQLEVGRFGVFAYLVGSEATGEALVIDPAAEAELLVKEAKAHNLHIKYIVNTHSHVDHVMGNRKMKELTGAEIIIHEAEAPYLTGRPDQMTSMFGAEPSPPADVKVRDNDVITVGDISLKVLHTPGHSPGAICLHTDGLVFTGDTLFVGGLGRTDFPGGSFESLTRDIRTKLFVLPDETVVLPGHGPATTIGREKRFNPFF